MYFLRGAGRAPIQWTFQWRWASAVECHILNIDMEIILGVHYSHHNIITEKGNKLKLIKSPLLKVKSLMKVYDRFL